MKAPRKLYVQWSRVDTFVDRLVEQIQECDFEPDSVFTFPKGGLCLAAMVANRFNIPIVMNPTKHSIIIDDICDSGVTLKKYSDIQEARWKEEKDNHFFIAVMYIRENQLEEDAEYPCNINYFCSTVKDEWVVFPWEENNSGR